MGHGVLYTRIRLSLSILGINKKCASKRELEVKFLIFCAMFILLRLPKNVNLRSVFPRLRVVVCSFTQQCK
jgi:hypothetical protein